MQSEDSTIFILLSSDRDTRYEFHFQNSYQTESISI